MSMQCALFRVSECPAALDAVCDYSFRSNTQTWIANMCALIDYVEGLVTEQGVVVAGVDVMWLHMSTVMSSLQAAKVWKGLVFH